MSAENIGYGSHPTKFSSLSNDALFSMYRGEQWFGMDEGDRQQLLQETVNRVAAARGEVGACRVVFEDLDNGVLGAQSGNTISLNREAFVNDQRVATYNGVLITEPLLDSNMQALETLIHENEHAWQNQCIDGTIEGNPQLTEQYRANDFTVSVTDDANGNPKVGSHYLDGSGTNGYYLYYFQSTERDAHRFSQLFTDRIMTELEAKYGTEASFEEYRANIQANGYEATLKAAKEAFDNENFERDLNNTLMNQYYGTDTPVDPNTERAVKDCMIASFEESQKASQNIQHSEKENNMTVAPYTPVTQEQYDNTMHDSVNAFYTHQLNDPSVSQEEAISSTAQMAERGLTASEEFAAANEQANSSAENNATASAEVSNDNGNGVTDDGNGIGDDGGVGDDDDGGIE